MMSSKTVKYLNIEIDLSKQAPKLYNFFTHFFYIYLDTGITRVIQVFEEFAAEKMILYQYADKIDSTIIYYSQYIREPQNSIRKKQNFIGIRNVYTQRESVSCPCPVSIDAFTTMSRHASNCAMDISLGIHCHSSSNARPGFFFCNTGVCCSPGDLRFPKCSQMAIYWGI